MNCWILQCNPNHYRWFKSVKEYGNEPDTWGINPLKNKKKLDKIEPGDTVFIWLSNEKGKSNRGIYAMATVSRFPAAKYDWEDEYWIDKEEQSRIRDFPRLEITYTNLKIKNSPLLVNKLKAGGLEDLSIIRNAQGGLFEVTEKQCNAIKRIIV